MAGEPYYFDPNAPQDVELGMADYAAAMAPQVPVEYPTVAEFPAGSPQDVELGTLDYAQALAPQVPVEGPADAAPPQEPAGAAPPAPHARPPGYGGWKRDATDKKEFVTKHGKPLTQGQQDAMLQMDAAVAAGQRRDMSLLEQRSDVRQAMETQQAAANVEAVKRTARRQEALRDAQQKIADADEATHGFKFQDFFSSRGAASGISAMLGMAAAGFLQGWSNGKVNMMPMFEKMIDQDFDRQRAEYQRLRNRGVDAKNAYGMLVDKFDTDELRKLQFHKASMDQMSKQLMDINGNMRDNNVEMLLVNRAKLENEIGRQVGDEVMTKQEYKETLHDRYRGVGTGAGPRPPLSKRDDIDLAAYIRDVEKAGIMPAKRVAYKMKRLLADPQIRQMFNEVGAIAWDANAMAAGKGAAMLKDPEFAKKYTELMQTQQAMVNQKIKDRAGTAVSANEMARVMREMRGSGSYDDQANAVSEYLGFMRDYDDMAQNVLSDAALAELEYRYERGQSRENSPSFSNPKLSPGGGKPVAQPAPTAGAKPAFDPLSKFKGR